MKAIKDIYKRLSSIRPAAYTATTNGAAINLANVHENMLTLNVGTITDGTHTPKLQYSADGSTGWVDVAATDQVGTLTALASNTDQQVSYIGIGGYLRWVVTVSGATTGGVYGAGATVKYRRQP